jgi:hypothetical protein
MMSSSSLVYIRKIYDFVGILLDMPIAVIFEVKFRGPFKD